LIEVYSAYKRVFYIATDPRLPERQAIDAVIVHIAEESQMVLTQMAAAIENQEALAFENKRLHIAISQIGVVTEKVISKGD